ncbi:MAG TPA: hypothetical protein VIF62_21115 [Labilithrix sp.]|jgi:hypothetical protein
MKTILMGAVVIHALLFVGCSAPDDSTTERTSTERESLMKGGGGGGASYQCSDWETSRGGGCSCDGSLVGDCTGMSTYCRKNGGNGIVTCDGAVCWCTY